MPHPWLMGLLGELCETVSGEQGGSHVTGESRCGESLATAAGCRTEEMCERGEVFLASQEPGDSGVGSDTAIGDNGPSPGE